MIFKITKASDWEYKDAKDFNSLDEIINFVKTEYTQSKPLHSPACVLYFPENETPELQIYDSWIE